jgi:hypothetical protein
MDQDRKAILTHSARNKIIIAGRRWRKTVTGWLWLFQDGIEANENYSAFCPYLKQARKNIWPLMQEVGRELGIKPNKSDLSMTFPNGGVVQLFGTDNPDSIPGSGLKKAWMDEYSLWKDQDVYSGIIRPMLTISKGPSLFTTSPRGHDKSYDLYMKGQDPNNTEWMSWLFKTKDSPFVDPKEVEAARVDMDPFLFEREYNASFETGGNLAAYMYKRDLHMKRHDERSACKFIGLDFNVQPMVAEIGCVYSDNSVHFYDEVVIHNNANTGEMVKRLRAKHPDINDIYPDATGSARSSVSPRSNHQILRDAGYNVIARKAPPHHVDRLAAFNRALQDGEGGVHLTIDPVCKLFHADCEKAERKSDGSIDKKKHDPHAFDAGTYPIEYMFPITNRKVLSLERFA